MSLLVRRIARAKWDSFDTKIETKKSLKSLLVKVGIIKPFADVSADAITNCLKTNDNTLSVWEIEDETEINDAILALVTGKKQEKFSTIHYVIIDKNTLNNNGLTAVDFDGDTVVEDLVKKHKNISNLSYSSLGLMKNIILDCISSNKVNTITRAQQKELVVSAIENGRLMKDALNSNLVTKEKL